MSLETSRIPGGAGMAMGMSVGLGFGQQASTGIGAGVRCLWPVAMILRPD
jgi:hypothetical protein